MGKNKKTPCEKNKIFDPRKKQKIRGAKKLKKSDAGKTQKNTCKKKQKIHTLKKSKKHTLKKLFFPPVGERTCSGTPSASRKTCCKTFTFQATALSRPHTSNLGSRTQIHGLPPTTCILGAILAAGFLALGDTGRTEGRGGELAGVLPQSGCACQPSQSQRKLNATKQYYSLRTCLRQIITCSNWMRPSVCVTK